MPNISWNEIRHRALLFSREWSQATREQADKQTFWNDFFEIFGLSRRTLASFEEPVNRISGSRGFIDLFWPGRLLVEHKTAGHSLDSAESQAFAYIRDLVTSGRQDEVPRYILAVERCYRPEPFPNDQARVEFLFALYDKLAAPLLPAPRRPRRRS